MPDRLSLRRLREEAKRRKRSGEFDSLVRAQFAVAHERGFRSWPELKTHVELASLDRAGRVGALVESARSADVRVARALLAAEPDLAGAGIAAACVTGTVDEVRQLVAADPGAARRQAPPLGWEPILYATFSRLPEHAGPIVGVVRTLLDAGADPNVYWLDHGHRELPIFGAAAIAASPELTRLLLDAGADPNETYPDDGTIGESLYHAVESPDVTCLRMLLDAGVYTATKTYCVGRALDFPDPTPLYALLEYGARPHGGHVRTAVHRRRPAATVRALLDAGAPADEPDDGGLTPVRIAVRWGDPETVDLLLAYGADGSRVTVVDRAVGAAAAVPPPEMLDWAAHSGDAGLVRRLLAAGADVDGTGGDGPPLGQAAWRGHIEVVRVLVEHGAALVWPDGSALGAAVHGALHCGHAEGGPTMGTVEEIDRGGYAEVVRILLGAGAEAPVEAADVLARLGITT